MSAAHQLINASSGDTEIYTPSSIIEAARRTMGAIDLDPASSAKANERVKASLFFTRADNGLDPLKCWYGRVWLNHPFSREENNLWVQKAVNEYSAGRAHQVCMITFASTSEKWFRPLLEMPQCFLSPRTNYLRPDGTIYRGVTKGSVVTYFGSDSIAFSREFSGLGVVKVRY